MTRERVVVQSGAGGFCGLLTIAFIVLKLTGQVEWSWAWVLAPMWMPFALFIGVPMVLVVGAVVLDLTSRYLESRERRRR